MSDKMIPVPFSKLMNWILEEYHEKQTVFGVKAPFKKQTQLLYKIFEEKMETPFGPAAGPHTQLAQNIISAYFAGARFFELKTVQILDGEDMVISKPCIYAKDEGYNIEWSTELKVSQAMEEYIKAWFALKLISREFALGNPDGFVFNMSVGYDLEGIKSPKIDSFIEGLKDAEQTPIWKECKEYVLENLHLFKTINKEYVRNISPAVCTSVTLSTMHGCLPGEIEGIAAWLLTQKNLNTFIKCNPTLLGYEFVRETMDSMGYDYLDFDQHHFIADLQFEEAVPLIEKLLGTARSCNLVFGVKLTNTFPVNIKKNELSGEEMYMSGAPLYPLTIAVADKLSRVFEGKLQISLSGGANYFNIEQIVSCGIWPVTVSTDLLKPGGYNRILKITEKLEAYAESQPEITDFKGVDTKALAGLAKEARTDVHHIKKNKGSVIRGNSVHGLACEKFCGNCAGVCPNRANSVITCTSGESFILHMDDLCNECGNCETFCAIGCLPYKDKLTLFESDKDAENSDNFGFSLNKETGRIKICNVTENENIEEINNVIEAVQNNYRYLL